MPEGNTFDGSAFGFVDETIPAELGGDPFADEPEHPTDAEASQEQDQPRDERGRFASRDHEPVIPADTPSEEAAPPAPQAEEPAPQQPSDGSETPAEEVVFAGRRFPSQTEAERAYREMQSRSTRAEQELSELRRRQVETEQAMGQLIELQRQQRAQYDPEFAQRMEAERALQPLIDQRVAPLREQMERTLQELEIARQSVGVNAAITAFRTRHPEVQDGTAEDNAVASTLAELHEAWKSVGEELDLSDPESLELAYEATQDPYLKVILASNPRLSDTNEGLDYARWQAQQLGSMRRQGTSPQGSAQPAKKIVPQTAYVETGAGRAPKPSAEADEFDEVLAIDKADNERSPFFGSKR